MKGIILAGGEGTRLRPLTLTTNKHLLPVYNKQMIFYPLQTLLHCGVKDILIISGREHAGDFIELLGSGSQYHAKFTYKVQEEAGGIAQALGLAKDFINDELFTVILGDNIFENIPDISLRDGKMAKIFLKEVDDAHRFGVPEFGMDNEIEFIVEKPKGQHSGYAVTGLYIYDKIVFDVISSLKPSDRGELEITDVNNYYAKLELLDYEKIKGFWSDAGTFESLRQSNIWAGK